MEEDGEDGGMAGMRRRMGMEEDGEEGYGGSGAPSPAVGLQHTDAFLFIQGDDVHCVLCVFCR